MLSLRVCSIALPRPSCATGCSRPAERVGVAVSGGADSVCLLHVLRELAPRWDLRLIVLHLDHGLRGEESRQDAEFVRALAAGWGCRSALREADVARQSAGNLEAGGAGGAAGTSFARQSPPARSARVAPGHTRSDQAETVLFRFLRGAGTAGLAGIRPVTADGIVRPLIDIDRAPKWRQFLRARGIAVAGGLDQCAARVRAQPHPPRSFCRNLRGSGIRPSGKPWPKPRIGRWRKRRIGKRKSSGWRRGAFGARRCAVLLRADALAALPLAVARRLVRRAMERAKGDLARHRFRAHCRGAGLGRAAEGHGRVQAPGLDIFRSFDWLRFAPPRVRGVASPHYRADACPCRASVRGARPRNLPSLWN